MTKYSRQKWISDLGYQGHSGGTLIEEIQRAVKVSLEDACISKGPTGQ